MTLTRTQWRTRTDWSSVCARASGRRKYNEERRKWAGERQDVVFELLLQYGWDTWGVLTKIADELRIHKFDDHQGQTAHYAGDAGVTGGTHGCP